MTQPPQHQDWQHIAKNLDLPDQVLVAQPLSGLTTFRIGGPAGLVCRVKNVDDAQRFLETAWNAGGTWTCLGGGSNILADDAGYDGVVLLVETRSFEVRHDVVQVGAGWEFDALVARTLAERLTGLEFASGIPGTIGGALVGNAGCYGREIGDLLLEATVLRRDGKVETLGPEDFAFTYRDTALKARGDLVLDLTLALSRGSLDAAVAERDQHLADRRRKHPWREACAGSYFKNLPPLTPGQRRRAAGVLLEQVGAKTMREGNALVYHKHANIIVNRGGARSADILALATRMKSAVHDRFGVVLEEEVRHLVTPCTSSAPEAD